MIKIDELVGYAFKNGQNLTISNTKVTTKEVLLHGNCIAKRENGKVLFSKCGWDSNVTRDRLNALGCECRIKNGVLERTDGKPFDF